MAFIVDITSIEMHCCNIHGKDSTINDSAKYIICENMIFIT